MILIMKCFKSSCLLEKIGKILEILRSKEPFIKDILKAFYNCISPWFLKGNKYGLYIEVKAKAYYQPERVGITIASPHR